MAHLRHSLVWRLDGVITLGITVLIVWIWLLRGRLGKEFSTCLQSLLAGILLSLGILTYGWPVASMFMLGICLSLWLLATKALFPAPILQVVRFGIVVVTCQWSVLAADHQFNGGRIFATKWLHLEHPIFGPSEPLQIERNGSHAIYLYDTGRCLLSHYTAVVWGGSLFPRIVDLGYDKPYGKLVNHSKIQEVLP